MFVMEGVTEDVRVPVPLFVVEDVVLGVGVFVGLDVNVEGTDLE